MNRKRQDRNIRSYVWDGIANKTALEVDAVTWKRWIPGFGNWGALEDAKDDDSDGPGDDDDFQNDGCYTETPDIEGADIHEQE